MNQMTPPPSTYEMTPVGQVVDACVDNHDITLHVGGRGSGKTTNALLSVVKHVHQYGPQASVLILRESHSGLIQLQLELFAMLIAAYGPQGVNMNKNAGTITCSNGAMVELQNMSDERSYVQIQGKSYTFLMADEAGQYTANGWKLMFTVMSNLRGPKGMHTPTLILGNPYGQSHGRIVKTFLKKRPFWESYTDEDGLRIIHCTSTLFQNPHIDHDAYVRRIKKACNGDKEKEKAWIDGDFNLNISSFWGDVWNPEVHLLPDLIGADIQHLRPRWRIGADWGTASPSVALLGCELRRDLPVGERLFRSGSVLVMDETTTVADWDDLSVGNGATPQSWAEQIKFMAKIDNGLKACPPVCTDDARGLANDTVTSLMQQAGVPAYKPTGKDRQGNFALVRQLLNNAITGDGRGLYVSPKCRYIVETLPDAPRNPNNINDLDPKWNEDHGVDALAYLVADLVLRKARYGRTSGDY